MNREWCSWRVIRVPRSPPVQPKSMMTRRTGSFQKGIPSLPQIRKGLLTSLVIVMGFQIWGWIGLMIRQLLIPKQPARTMIARLLLSACAFIKSLRPQLLCEGAMMTNHCSWVSAGWSADDPKTVYQTLLHKFVFMRQEEKNLLTETETKSIIALNNLSFCWVFGRGNNSVVTLTWPHQKSHFSRDRESFQSYICHDHIYIWNLILS